MAFINAELAARSGEGDGKGRVLLISVSPTVTTVREMRELLKELVIPKRNPFEGIYLIGMFTLAKGTAKAELEVRQLA